MTTTYLNDSFQTLDPTRDPFTLCIERDQLVLATQSPFRLVAVRAPGLKRVMAGVDLLFCVDMGVWCTPRVAMLTGMCLVLTLIDPSVQVSIEHEEL